MRLPQVHRLFGIPNDKGLADAIRNPEDIDDFLVPSGVEGLTLLPSGQAPANPAELLSRPECKELLESLRQRYSYVILDCPRCWRFRPIDCRAHGGRRSVCVGRLTTSRVPRRFARNEFSRESEPRLLAS